MARDRDVLPVRRIDDSAVAGFFEDIPVLLFVLAGVVSLVFSALLGAAQREERRLQSELDQLADSIADRVVGKLHHGDVLGDTPTMATVMRTDLAAIASRLSLGHGCDICFVRVHPGFSWLSGTNHSCEDPPVATGYASRLFNGLDDKGLIGILEVRVLVWEA